jgi:exopolysaccharide production protein ExoQ
MYRATAALRRSNLFERIRVSLETPEKLYVLFALLYFVGAFSPSDVGENMASRQWQFDRISYFAQIAVFAVLALLLFARWKAVSRGLRHAAWPLAMCAFAILSASWSDDPFFTVRRAIVLLATTVFAIYFGSCFDWDSQIQIFEWLFLVSIVGSVLMIVFAPQFGVSHDMHMGALKGMFSHKNLLGRQMALGILTVVVGKPLGMPRWLRASSVLAAFPLLVLAHSAGALLSLVIVFVAYMMLRIPRPRYRSSPPLWLGLLPLLLVGGFLLLTNAGTFLSLLGRDSSLTGRVPLWVAIDHAIGRRVWLGYGYALFWVRQTGSLQEVVATGWNALSAQNGYLDLALDLGMIGVSLFFCSLVSAIRHGFHALRSKDIRTPSWPMLFILFFAVQNIHESDLLRLGTFMWVPFVATSVALSLMDCRASIHLVENEPRRTRARAWSPNPEHSESGIPAYES